LGSGVLCCARTSLSERPTNLRVVWRLRLPSTQTEVEGRIEHTVSKTFIVTVVSGSEVFLDEVYPDSSSAMSRALQVRDSLLAGDDWTSVSEEDPT
jgi:hypothetical protein